MQVEMRLFSNPTDTFRPVRDSGASLGEPEEVWAVSTDGSRGRALTLGVPDSDSQPVPNPMLRPPSGIDGSGGGMSGGGTPNSLSFYQRNGEASQPQVML